jgi:hypothetical protein
MRGHLDRKAAHTYQSTIARTMAPTTSVDKDSVGYSFAGRA